MYWWCCLVAGLQVGDGAFAPARDAVRAWFGARLEAVSDAQRAAMIDGRQRTLRSWPVGDVGRRLLARPEALRATFSACFDYPEVDVVSGPVALPGIPGVRVFVPAAYDPRRPVATVIRVWPSDAELGRIALEVGPDPGLGTAIVVFATPRQLEALVPLSPRMNLGDALESGAADLLGFVGASGWAARLRAHEVDDELVQRGLFALLGVVLRGFNVDRDRLVLDCAGQACPVGLRAVTSAPDRFAGVVLRAVPRIESVGLENLAGVPVLILRGLSSFEESGLLKRQIDRITDCEVWNVDDAQSARVSLWCAECRRELMRTHVALVMRPDAAVDGYWVTDISSEGAAGDGDGPARIDVRVDRELGAIWVDCRRIDRFTLLLNDELLDLDRPFQLDVNGVSVVLRRTPSFSFLCETVFDRFDPGFLFSAEITVDVPRRG